MVRKASEMLSRRSFVSIQQGKGMQILAFKSAQKLGFVTSFSENLSEQGYDSTAGRNPSEFFSSSLAHRGRYACRPGGPTHVYRGCFISRRSPRFSPGQFSPIRDDSERNGAHRIDELARFVPGVRVQYRDRGSCGRYFCPVDDPQRGTAGFDAGWLAGAYYLVKHI